MKIIMADDDPDDRNLMQLVWKSTCIKHELSFAKDGEDLMNLLNSLNRKGQSNGLPSVILLDLNMPKKDGRQALKEIKSVAGFKEINVMIFTTSNSEADRKFALENGACKYIVKPFQLDEWKEIVKGICNEVTNGCNIE